MKNVLPFSLKIFYISRLNFASSNCEEWMRWRRSWWLIYIAALYRTIKRYTFSHLKINFANIEKKRNMTMRRFLFRLRKNFKLYFDLRKFFSFVQFVEKDIFFFNFIQLCDICCHLLGQVRQWCKKEMVLRDFVSFLMIQFICK